MQEFDAAVGDIAIIARRYKYVEFSHAHTESGLVMVVPILKHSNKTWLFMKPFTKAMWLLTVFVNVYNGFVVWSIEKDYCTDLKGPFLHQIGTLIWLAFATLFSLHSNFLDEIALMVPHDTDLILAFFNSKIKNLQIWFCHIKIFQKVAY